MSASNIEIDEITVSASDTNLTELSAEELLAVVAELQQENKSLRKSKEKVGLTFKRVPEDGNDALRRLEDGQFPYLTRINSLSVDKVEPNDGNLALIEGENLAALAALQMTHKGKVDVIYIDPPYNTGSDDFVYEDKRVYKSSSSDLKNLENTLEGKIRTVGKDDPFRHSKWLSFMERRLFLAKELLNETGVIFVSIDDNEQARLKLLMDEIFGEDNFIASIVWNGGKKNNSRFVSVGHDYILSYTKDKGKLIEKDVKWRVSKKGVKDTLDYAHKIFTSEKSFEMAQKKFRTYLSTAKNLKKIGDSVSRFSFLDEKTGEPFNPDKDLSAPGGNGPKYEILHPITNKICNSPRGGWRWTQERMQEEIKLGNVFFGDTEIKVPRGKQYLKDSTIEVFGSVFTQERSAGTEQVEDILGVSKFSYPKELQSIKNLIEMSTNKDSLVLDFFAGSGTTGHAVSELNKEDGGNRSCILVTNNEGGIAQNVTQKRIARVLTGENWHDRESHEALPGNLSYYRLDFKTLSSNPLTTAQILEGKFDSLLSLENNTLNVVENDREEDYAIYRNSGKVIFVWKNLFSLYDGECEELLESAKSSMKADEFIAYVPSESSEHGISVDGWQVIPFPDEYIKRYNAMINTMRRNQTLPNNK